MTLSAEQMILVALTLIDLTLAANLLLIVMFSGYENFVSKLDIDDGGDRPDWMGKVDFSGLKMKLIASIVAISGIHLLKRFMEIGDSDRRSQVWRNRALLVGLIHLTFVVSGVLLALMDWLSPGPSRSRGESCPTRFTPASTAPLVMIGFGSIGRGTLPLIERHIGFDRRPFTVIEPRARFRHLLAEHGIRHLQVALTRENIARCCVGLFPDGEGMS